jgi:large subunit ribosomal protein L6
MSRIGKLPITVPAGVSVQVQGSAVSVKGAKGELALTLSPLVQVTTEEGQVTVIRKDDSKPSRSMHGTTRSLIKNMIQGVNEGYSKVLEIQGVGYKAVPKGSSVVFSLGYSHEIDFPVPDGVQIEVPSPTEVKISGADKQKVGAAAARIRGFAPAEPYKGKGVRYKGEQIRRKEGKAVA